MDFGRLITAMITPMTADFKVDYQKAQQFAEHLINEGSDALVICGTTGESPTLSEEEKLKLFSAIKEVLKGKAPVIAGTSSYNTANSVELTKKAEKAGADAILAVTPYYNKPPQEGLYQHFAALAKATSLPIMVYNVPSRTQCNILPATIARLSAFDNIVAVKESTGIMDQTSELKLQLPERIAIYSGDDSVTLPMMALGAKGIVSVAGNIASRPIKEMVEAYAAGDMAKAQAKHLELFPLFRKMFIDTNPIPVKHCANLMGFAAGPCRLPLVTPSAETDQILKDLVKEYGLKYA